MTNAVGNCDIALGGENEDGGGGKSASKCQSGSKLRVRLGMDRGQCHLLSFTRDAPVREHFAQGPLR